ncbi:uncharacterized protein LOC122088373 [Macadamia integrifolia]|uniref:uncharacterized protein LOC122088373 n=1 Tax=Macadamia integrifolia TaxID=60698 RepID=UPI001C4FAD25|nr:uncharacterized protein LOC122088373 [Macadamia integrifolia]XP_042513560.1 uncharacterized protein LOC122088373 [Macadamia integrifolia]XP_042513561.1 uncharacterized protein LOC122088373 [Macadamia integrifolia]
MLLRSSSTPVFGSLLSSFSDSPNRDFENSSSKNNKYPSSSDHNLKKISFSHGGHSYFSSFSCNSSPITPSLVGFPDFDPESSSAVSRGVRRARSEGNLEALAAASRDIEDSYTSKPLTRRSRRPSMSVLETIPSFSVYNKRDGYEEERENEEEEEEELGERDGLLGRSPTIGDCIMSVGSGGFSFAKNKNSGLIVGEELSSGVEEAKESKSPPLYLARGIGIGLGGGGGGAGGCGGGGGNGFSLDGFGEGARPEGSQIEEYYKRMVDENPCNPLFLRNYAQFLYQSKGDLQGAEQYYSRAILVDPTDGEIMSQYAKLLWELHHDRDRATSYFERAVQAAPGDSHVLAAYASFLWDTEDEEEGSLSQDLAGAPAYHTGALASASA